MRAAMTGSSGPGETTGSHGAGAGCGPATALRPAPAASTADSVPLRLTAGGRGEPLAAGVPFRQGTVREVADLVLRGEDGSALACQWRPLARWPDGSFRWVLVELLRGDRLAGGAVLRVEAGRDRDRRVSLPGLDIEEGDAAIAVDTGAARFALGRKVLGVEGLLAGAAPREAASLACDLTAAEGRRLSARVQDLEIEARGPLRATFRIRGAFAGTRRGRFLEFEARVSFFAGTGLVRLELTARNPDAAKHRGGLWDLGDPGSRLFADLSLRVRLPGGGAASRLAWRAEPGGPLREAREGPVSIFQASSGGENWKSRNHVNRHGEVPLAFRGYRVEAGGSAEHGLRASPVILLETSALRIGAAVAGFWEQFPKVLGAGEDGLRIGLFPREHGDLFELQGGEEKTHAAYLLLEPPAAREEAPLAWVHSPGTMAVDPRHLADSLALGPFLPSADDPHTDYQALIESGISGPACFAGKRETIDEYGWRHFGDLPADHENTYYSGPRPVISHYNNQYDLIYGLLLEFARSGRKEWFELGRDLALHVMDIDIYHTRADRPEYSGGLFWHTDHYAEAGRATHRTYSGDHPRARAGEAYGGGPANEHNYTSGLLLFHYLTGNPRAREAVIGLADWVLAMDDGVRTRLGFLDPGPTGKASSTASTAYHGPGRGAGNSVNALLDAFALTAERRYLEKGEQLIRRSIHPRDDIAERNLGDLEARWSYLVFLQVLGKYLDLKEELAEPDAMYEYARRSLLHYARWMLDGERPYLEVLERVEYPTETWPAHDLRKSVVFDHAARHDHGECRQAFRGRAAFFFRACLDGLGKFETRTCTRPLAILLQNGALRGYCQRHEPRPAPPGPRDADFGPPSRFLPQEERVKALLRTPRGWARLLARPAGALGLVLHALGRFLEARRR